MSRFLSVNCQSDSHDGCPEMTPDRASRCACSCHAADLRRRAFERFNAENPHIYSLLVERAREAKQAGEDIGMRCIWEVLRWDLRVKTRRPEGAPKLNDWYPPFFARLIDAQEPDLRGFFELRGHANQPMGEG